MNEPSRFDEPFTSQLLECEQERLAEILDDYLRAIEQGSPIAPEDLLQQHPDDAEYLAQYLSGLKFFHASAVESSMGFSPTAADVESRQRKRIGDYELLNEIGRGGMGVVYDAQQLSLGRHVALKVLPLFATRDAKKIQRFKNEARAAASIEHPNIVPVYAIGTESGTHFYAMQLIEGQSLSEVLEDLRTGKADELETVVPPAALDRAFDVVDAKPKIPSSRRASFPILPLLPTAVHVRTVARLGHQAAEALHAAHQYGVVHRDVKPSNLLVDDEGKLWVTDFGLASCRDTTGLTQSGDVLGTMRYMSPEQSRGDHAMIDRRTDVFSLGVTLYELASLHHPTGTSSDFELLSGQNLFKHQPIRSWNREIPKDFQTIMMKSMEENPAERYSSAKELAEDLNRFIEGRPILASPPNVLMRAVKLLRRNRKLATMLGVLFVIAFLVQSANTLLLQQKNREKDQALVAAHENLQQAHQVLDRFGSRLVDQLVAIPGAEGVRFQLLNDSLKFYQQFEERTRAHAEWDTELAQAYSKMGSLSEKLGQLDVALQNHLAALDVWKERQIRQPRNRTFSRNLAICQNNVGLLLAELNRHDEGLAELSDAKQRQESLLEDEKSAWADAIAIELAATCNNIGMVYKNQANPELAIQFFQEAIRINEQLLVEVHNDETVLRGLAVSYNNLASLSKPENSKPAESNYRRAIEIQMRLVSSQPINRIYQSDLGCTYNNLGFLMASTGDWKNAEIAYRDAKLLQEHLVRSSPTAVSYRRELAVTLNNLGMAQDRLRQFEKSESNLKDAIKLQVGLLKSQPDREKTLSDLGGTYNNFGLLMAKQSRFQEAHAAFELAIENQTLALRASPDSQHYRKLLSNHYVNYANFLREDLHQTKKADEISEIRNNL